MSETKLHYGFADRAWHVCFGCDPHMSCAPRCWERKTMARVVECQRPTSPERAKLYQVALTPDLQKWSGEVVLDEAHLLDPLRWKKPAIVAAGFHGDWGRLAAHDLAFIVGVMGLSAQHQYFPLTKVPEKLVQYFSNHPKTSSETTIKAWTFTAWALKNKEGKHFWVFDALRFFRARKTALAWKDGLEGLTPVRVEVTIREVGNAK